MPRTELPEGFVSSAPRSDGLQSAAAVGRWATKLAGYGVATVAFTLMLLRPRQGAGGRRGSLFLGSGVVVVLMRALLGGSDDPSASPAAPVLAAAAPVVPAAAAAVASTRAAAPARGPAPRAQQAPQKPAPGGTVAAGPAAGAPNARPQAAARRVAAPATPPAKGKAPAAPRAMSALGARYTDRAGGYSVQFPVGWTSRPLKDGCWVIDASDGQAAAISVGFSRFPAAVSVDQLVPEKVTKGLQKRAGTVVHASGFGSVAGRRCVWHKYTGPVSRPEGNARMTVVHYLLPLQDGRALEVRVAATPERFGEMAPRMKQSLDSFKLLTPVASASRAR